MATNKTPPEKYFELVELNYIRPAMEHVDLTMPTLYRTVPTRLVYHVPEPDIKEGVHADAELEHSPKRDKKGSRERTQASS